MDQEVSRVGTPRIVELMDKLTAFLDRDDSQLDDWRIRSFGE
jgi:hypothetical protein